MRGFFPAVWGSKVTWILKGQQTWSRDWTGRTGFVYKELNWCKFYECCGFFLGEKIKLQQTTILHFLYSFNRMDDVWGGGAETFNEKLLKGWKILHYNYLFLCV